MKFINGGKSIVLFVSYIILGISILFWCYLIYGWIHGNDNLEAWSVLVGAIISTVLSVLTILKGNSFNSGPSNYSLKDIQRTREILINRVKKYWIDDWNSNALILKKYVSLLVELNPNLVENHLENIVSEIKVKKRTISLKKSENLLSIFEKNLDVLLIVGAPGSGKTTLLTRLANSLLAKAKDDETKSIPIIINISNWDKKEGLRTWLVEEISTTYNLTQEFVNFYLTQRMFILLLDGIDEIKSVEYQESFINSFNQFKKEEWRGGKTVICSRKQEYNMLRYKIKGQKAIDILPLAKGKIKGYLKELQNKGLDLTALINLTKVDKNIKQLITSPLMLNVMIIAYLGENNIQIFDELKKQKENIFFEYTVKMFNRRKTISLENKGIVLKKLIRVARIMKKLSIDTFTINKFQHTWIQESPNFTLYKIIIIFCLSVFLALGIAISNLILGHAFGESFFVVIPIFYFIFFIIDEYMKLTIEKIKFIHSIKIDSNKFITGFQFGGQLGVMSAFIHGFFNSDNLEFHLGALILHVIVLGFAFGLKRGLKTIETKESSFYFESIKTTFKIFITYFSLGTISNIILTYILWKSKLVGFDVANSIVFALLVTFYLFYITGGFTILKHYSLRLVLMQSGDLPFKVFRLFDLFTYRIFMYKIGGGYKFIHRSYQEFLIGLTRDQIIKISDKN